MTDSRKYWVGLNMVKGIGAARLRVLLDAFDDAQSAWQADPRALRETGLPAKIIDNLINLHNSISLDEIWENIASQNIRVLIWDDDDYPVRLREIHNAPPGFVSAWQLDIG